MQGAFSDFPGVHSLSFLQILEKLAFLVSSGCITVPRFDRCRKFRRRWIRLRPLPHCLLKWYLPPARFYNSTASNADSDG